MNKIQIRKILFLVLLFLAATRGFGQNIGAKATLDTNAMLIGDQIHLNIDLTVPSGSKVSWPLINDTVTAHVEVLRRSAIDTVYKDNDKFTLRQSILITSFDSGYYAISPIPFRFKEKNDTVTYYAETQALDLTVNTLKVDEKKDIKPIKPPLNAPVTFAEIFPWVLLGLGIILIIFLVLYYLRKKKRQEPVFQFRQKPKLPAHVVALESLDKLRSKKLWQAGKVKEYYTELTDIIRVYIEDRFKVTAMEMTTDEIMSGLKKEELAGSSRTQLKEVLVMADLVKFAKAQPLPLDNENNFNSCIEFVRETRLKEDLTQPAKKDNVEPLEQNNKD